MSYPLEGLRVLDISRVLAGPFAARMLADLGADVVKVEPPDGDTTRIWGAVIGGNPGYYHQQNAGKRNICVDLAKPGGAALIAALAAKADVVVENFRPGVANRLGVGYADLNAANPRLIMLSISGFGQDGPEAQRAAFAPIIHAESGIIARQAAVANNPPADLAMSVADTNAGLHGLVALLSALLMRERTGLGQHIDLAMLDAMLATDDSIHFDLEDSWATRLLPSDIWETAAGNLLISADFRHIWKNLAAVMGVADPSPPAASVDEKAASRRAAAREYLKSLPDEATVIAALDRMNLAWGRVRDASTIREQPTVKHRRAVTDVDDRAGGTRPIVQSPYRFSAAESGVRGPAPWQGEHNDEVLREWLGPGPEEIESWRGVLVDRQSNA